jgi:hypothetical protein
MPIHLTDGDGSAGGAVEKPAAAVDGYVIFDEDGT